VTALVVQDAFGGEILRGVVHGIDHYWNRLPDSTEVDLTKSQFGSIREVPPINLVLRDQLLLNGDTLRRYRLLRESVDETSLTRARRVV
jgi:hypothetical protein